MYHIVRGLASIEKPSVLMMVGLAGSGKSSVVEKLSDALRQVVPLSVVCPDDIRDELSATARRQARRSPELSHRAWAEAYRRVEAALHAGDLVIVDGTHLDEYRNLAMERYRQYGARKIAALVLDVPIDIAKARNEARGAIGEGYVEPHEIDRMEAFRLKNSVTPETPDPFDVVYMYSPADRTSP
jgi:predicted kinase